MGLCSLVRWEYPVTQAQSFIRYFRGTSPHSSELGRTGMIASFFSAAENEALKTLDLPHIQTGRILNS